MVSDGPANGRSTEPRTERNGEPLANGITSHIATAVADGKPAASTEPVSKIAEARREFRVNWPPWLRVGASVRCPPDP